MRDFDKEREERQSGQNYTFKIDGHEFHFKKAVDQDFVDAYFDALEDTEGGNRETVKRMDELVLACLEPEDHEAWQHARHASDVPVMGSEMHTLIGHMLGVMLNRPTERRTDSTGTPKDTGTSSTEKSPSPEESP